MFPHCADCKVIQSEAAFKESKIIKTGNQNNDIPKLYMHLAINAVPKVRHGNV
jgi:hypothetical protein